MSLRYGFNIGTSDMKSLLEQEDAQLNGVRSWKQLFSGASQQFAASNAAITSSFSDTIAQAYKANLAQQDAIASAGLNIGATHEMIENNRAALHSAYQTYIQNYGKAVDANMQNYSATVKAYDDELTARAENFSKLYNYAYQYLAEELAGSAKGETSWLTANNLDWLYDTELNAAKSWETLSHELFDENRQITEKGREFFDAMFNARAEGYLTSKGKATRGFDQWLSDTDTELRDWAVTGDVYNSTEMGTNFGTAKSLLGLESTDQNYANYQYKRTAQEYLSQFSNKTFDQSKFTTLTESIQKIDELTDSIAASERAKENPPKAGASSTDYNYVIHHLRTQKEQKFKDIQPILNEYINEYQTQLSDIDAQMEKALGSERFSLFNQLNKDFITNFQNKLAEARTIEGVDVIKNGELNKLYNEYLIRLEAFINSNI